MTKLEIIRLKVVGEQTIHCASCENAIQTGLSRLPGIKRVRANHKTQTVEVSADTEQTGPKEVQEWLAWAGYEAEPA